MGNIGCLTKNPQFQASYAAVQQDDDDDDDPYNDPFFKIFKSSSSKCSSLITCDAIQRMGSGLKYYSSLCVMHENDEHNKQFIEFCQMVYHKTLLNDYIHIITSHDAQLSQIAQIVADKHMMHACNINTCDSITRHYNCKHKDDPELLFYVNIMDAMHCYILHSFEEKRSTNAMNFDAYRKISRNKFNIDINHLDHNLFRDNLCKYMVQDSRLKSQQINEMKQILVQHEYDSDAIQNDIEFTDEKCSNIAQEADHKCYNAVKTFLNTHDSDYISTQNVEIGYKFLYWDAYETSSEYAFGGYLESELFIVASRYCTLKEEILNNNIFTLEIDEFKQSVHKANKFINTLKVKKSQCFVDEDPLKFGIEFGAKLTFSHLLSVILWCDWMKLCISLKSTLRRQNVFETIESVKNRNGEYRNWSKLLTESVQYFGDPFCRNTSCVYCVFGDNKIIVPHTYMKLNNFTSCSRNLEVIKLLNPDQGMIFTLNDMQTWHDVIGLDSFSCNWCSRYCEENEMLFCGGDYRIKIQNIYNLETKEHFQVFLRSLFSFEFMINGNQNEDFVTKPYIEQLDCDILDHLIQRKLGINNNKYPQYIHYLFGHLTNTLNEIIINLDYIDRYFKQIKHLLIDDDDVPKELIFQLFPNIQYFIMYASDATGKYIQYPMDLLAFLEILTKSSKYIQNDIQIIIVATHKYEWNAVKMCFTCVQQSWCADAFCDQLQNQYKQKKFNIQLTQQINTNCNKVDAQNSEPNQDTLRITKII